MENQKADRLKAMLEEAMIPVIERLERTDKELKDLKDNNETNVQLKLH
ncbi:hypothetical protein [Paucisalibacillus sp. EB02]|nr:hypothetical protein [Paucisalibacillus sp. EB02]